MYLSFHHHWHFITFNWAFLDSIWKEENFDSHFWLPFFGIIPTLVSNCLSNFDHNWLQDQPALAYLSKYYLLPQKRSHFLTYWLLYVPFPTDFLTCHKNLKKLWEEKLSRVSVPYSSLILASKIWKDLSRLCYRWFLAIDYFVGTHFGIK